MAMLWLSLFLKRVQFILYKKKVFGSTLHVKAQQIALLSANRKSKLFNNIFDNLLDYDIIVLAICF